MNKIERISAILIKLQSRKYVTAQHIADQFGISLRTVYRDIRVLEEAGIPIVSNMGVGYSLVEGYKLPPLMFSTEEAIAFLMAEKALGMQTDSDMYELFRSGMDKVRAVLKAAEKDILEDFDNHIHALGILGPPPSKPKHILQPLLESIIRKKAVEINYTDSRMETSVRMTEPIGIFCLFQHWYVLAWCRAKNDYRTFRLERIEHLKPADEGFTKSHPGLKPILRSLFPENAENLYRVTIKLDKVALQFMGAGKYLHGLSSERVSGDSVIQEYTVSSLEYFGKWYLSFADQAEIIEPAELKSTIKDLIKKIKL